MELEVFIGEAIAPLVDEDAGLCVVLGAKGYAVLREFHGDAVRYAVHMPQVGARLLRHQDTLAGISGITVKFNRQRTQVIAFHMLVVLKSTASEHDAFSVFSGMRMPPPLMRVLGVWFVQISVS